MRHQDQLNESIGHHWLANPTQPLMGHQMMSRYRLHLAPNALQVHLQRQLQVTRSGISFIAPKVGAKDHLIAAIQFANNVRPASPDFSG